MKNILIMGIGGAGKTTLSNMIKEKWNSYNLLQHAQDWYECNEMLKTECYKYGIKYIDTSKNRENISKEIVKLIEEENK